MNTTRHIKLRAMLLITAMVAATIVSDRLRADTGTCGGATTTLPFTDVQASNIFFCSIAQAYFSGLTNGTTATTYGPTQEVPREQMAAFITRTQDSAIKRSNKRAAFKQWWTPASIGAMRSTDLGNDSTFATGITFDGADLWVCLDGAVKRVRASDGKLLQTWNGAIGAEGIIVAAGRIFITGIQGNSPGKIYAIDPTATPGVVSVFENSIGLAPVSITFDGTNLWTANLQGSISRVDITTGVDSTFSAGFAGPRDILWDGANLWVVDLTDSHLKRVNTSNGSVLESIPVVESPQALVFDGTNIWVSGGGETSDNVSIVRAVGALRGTVLATRSTGANPRGIAFDGERVLVCNLGGFSVSLFKAADFTPLGTVSTGFQSYPYKACSDGLNFWIALGSNPASVMRF